MSGIETLFGVAAGGAGLISLAIQLGESAVKLKRIFNNVKNAPRTISRLIFSLEIMGMALRELEMHRQQDTHSGILLSRCITECQERTSDIQQLVDKMAQSMAKLDRLGRVYTALKDRELKGLLEELEKTKSSLELAYMIYLNAEQARRDQTHTSTFALHSTILNDLQAQVSAGNASTSQQLTLLLQSSMPPHPLMNTITADEWITKRGAGIAERSRNERVSHGNYSPPTRQAKRRAGAAIVHTKFQLPIWLSSRVWELAIDIAQYGWSANLRTYSIIPEDSQIFYYCRVGDIYGVQRLVEDGKGSLLDVFTDGSSGQVTLIEAAALAGQLDVCRYLLRQTPWPDPATTLNNALSWVPASYISDEESIEMYRLFLENPNFDTDLEDASHNYSWLEFCQDTECLDLVLEHQFPRFACMSAEARFEWVLRTNVYRYPIGCCATLKYIGLEQSDRRLALLRNSSGISILHYIATRIPSLDIPSDNKNLQDWLNLGEHVLKMGADPFCIARRDPWKYIGPEYLIPLFRSNDIIGKEWRSTPFMDVMGIRSWGIEIHGTRLTRLSTLIRIWVEMVREASIDLGDYGAKESQIWQTLGVQDDTIFKQAFKQRVTQSGHPPIRIKQLLFGSTPADWSLIYRRYKLIPIFKPGPGTFPNEALIPTTVIWTPTEIESRDGPWVLQGRKLITSEPIDLRSWVEEKEPFTELAQSTQDDSGVIPLMQLRMKHPRSPSRSHSQPSSIQRRKMGIENHYGRPWLGFYHLCPFDLRWRLSCVDNSKDGYFDARSCVKGISAGPLSIQETWCWRGNSYLAEIAACQDKISTHTRGRSHQIPEPMRHTGHYNCPQGCSKVYLDRIQVPIHLRRFHPRQKYKEY